MGGRVAIGDVMAGDGVGDRVRGSCSVWPPGPSTGASPDGPPGGGELGRARPVRRRRIGARYLARWRDGAFDTGPVAAEVLGRVDRGTPFDRAAAEAHAVLDGRTGGCNPAHRSPPLAMLAALDDELAEAAMAEAALTHVDPVAGDVAAATVVLCRALIRGHGWPDACRAAAEGRREPTASALGTQREPTDRGGFARVVLAAGVWFVDTSASAEEALARSIEFAGPANDAPVLVGPSPVPAGAPRRCHRSSMCATDARSRR